MNPAAALRYHLGRGLGIAALRLRRWQAEARRDSAWDSEFLAPPLRIDPWTKELIGRHYLQGRLARPYRKVAWVTSGAPVEFLKALDFHVLYPENHAALCGVARRAEEICGCAEEAGYSRDLCSYARTDIGTALSGLTPVGRLPPPDLLVACTNICQTVLAWYRVLAEHFQAPLVVIDTPFVYTEVGGHDLAFVRRQIEAAIGVAEQVAGRSLLPSRLEQVALLSRQAAQLWAEIIARGRHCPAPISVFDQFIQMAPVVEMRGESYTVDLYAAMLKEVDRRIARGIGAVKNEKKRLLWDNLPIWYRLRSLAEALGKHGAALVASTYTNAWGELADRIDTTDPIEGMARTYIYAILNRGSGDKLATMKRMIGQFQLDGVLLHSDRSCKPYSIGQVDQRDRLAREVGVPALLLEADHNDPRAFSEEQVAGRLEAFLEMLGV